MLPDIWFFKLWHNRCMLLATLCFVSSIQTCSYVHCSCVSCIVLLWTDVPATLYSNSVGGGSVAFTITIPTSKQLLYFLYDINFDSAASPYVMYIADGRRQHHRCTREQVVWSRADFHGQGSCGEKWNESETTLESTSQMSPVHCYHCWKVRNTCKLCTCIYCMHVSMYDFWPPLRVYMYHTHLYWTKDFCCVVHIFSFTIVHTY